MLQVETKMQPNCLSFPHFKVNDLFLFCRHFQLLLVNFCSSRKMYYPEIKGSEKIHTHIHIYVRVCVFMYVCVFHRAVIETLCNFYTPS